MEKPNRTFYDALTTLTAIGAVTERIELGTGSLIPFRHPLITALMAGTITQLVGPRLILGFGAGTFDHEFEAIGWGDLDRVEMVRSNAEILERVFTENDVTYSDDNFSFKDVTIEPKPVGGRVPFWYCGATPRSARLAVEFCDGWMPGRISMLTLEKRIAVDARPGRRAGQGRRRPSPSSRRRPSRRRARRPSSTSTSPGCWPGPTRPSSRSSRRRARSRRVEDLSGQLIVGSPDEAVAEVEKFRALGVEHLVFDFRFKFDRWFEQIELLGTEVLPKLR